MDGLVAEHPTSRTTSDRVRFTGAYPQRCQPPNSNLCDERTYTGRHAKTLRSGLSHTSTRLHMSSILRNAGKHLSSSSKHHKRTSGRPEERGSWATTADGSEFRTLIYNNIFTHTSPLLLPSVKCGFVSEKGCHEWQPRHVLAYNRAHTTILEFLPCSRLGDVVSLECS